MMESSEEDDDFPSIESITPQSKIDSVHQSHTEKGIRKLCCELLDLKDAVENLCGNRRTKYLAFLRMSEEVVEMEHELVELRKHISSQGIIVQDLMTGVCRELEESNQENADTNDTPLDPKVDDVQEEMDDPKKKFLEKIDVLLAEHKVEEALEALEAEEKNFSGDSSTQSSSYKSSFLERKAMLEDQLTEIAELPAVSANELKKALSGLIKLGKGPSAQLLLLKSRGSRLQKNIEGFLPSCSVCPKTFPAALSRLVFSMISLTTRESGLIFGDNPVYTNRVVQWAEWEIEFFVRLGEGKCTSFRDNFCTTVETLEVASVLLRPYLEEVLELNFRRARKAVFDSMEVDENLPLSPHFVSAVSAFATSSNSLLVDSGMKFLYIISDILEQLTPLVVSHFGGNVLPRISQLFDKYMDALIRALPGPSDDDSLTELKETIPFRAETDSEQLAILGIAFTIMDELLPSMVVKIWSPKNENQEPGNENIVPNASTTTELKDWRRQLQYSFDKLRDHFCRQYVLSFIYSIEGKTRLNAQIYLGGDGEDSQWDTLPSLPFQALFAKLQQLATVAGDVLLGKEKLQKILLARLTETVLMWLSNEQDFWGVFEDKSTPLQPLGLQQLILDMHFTVEIARFAGYPSRHVHQIASAITARAIRTFTARDVERYSSFPDSLISGSNFHFSSSN
ncbi:hypothetical protein E1A91_1Z022800v1 [Gossypium mustelinum]|uniref:Exocyst component Exo84 C-terminal domain-containing protein n=1 Tax=Gossypium mustelinum TaxID=34275 RepID=A0A5C7J1W8_GOSMU|nr:hypothetical protein E1A91_1Z022800v1 [Gossypium mustelinum]